MKEHYKDERTIILVIIIIAVLISLWFNTIEQKLDKLIEINTPEYINVVPEKIIIDKN